MPKCLKHQTVLNGDGECLPCEISKGAFNPIVYEQSLNAVLRAIEECTCPQGIEFEKTCPIHAEILLLGRDPKSARPEE